MTRSKILILFVVVVLTLGLIIVGGVTLNKNRIEREASMPTPTPTQLPMVDVVCRGGQIFIPDEEVQQILHDRYQINATTEYMGSFGMVAPDMNYEGIDCIWPGSAAAYAEFGVNHPGVEKDHEVIFKTLLMAFLRREYLDEALKANIVEKQGSAYTMDFENAVCTMLEEGSWADLNAPGIPGYIHFRGSAPESSGGGRSTLFLMAGYMVPGDLPREVRLSDLDKPVDCPGHDVNINMLDAIEKLWLVSGQQSDSSPENWTDFAMIPWPFAISSESLFIGGYNSVSEEVQEKFLEQFVGVYPTYTMSTDHILIAITPAGERLLEAFRNDPDLQRIGWEKYGMRIGIEGIGQTPGGIDIDWFLENPVVMPDPKTDVGDIVKDMLRNR